MQRGEQNNVRKLSTSGEEMRLEPRDGLFCMGVWGALLLGGCLVGCGAEVDFGDAELSTSRQALTSVELSTDAESCQQIQYRGRTTWACRATASVAPRGSAAPARDWGICGLTHLEGNADANSVVRIGVSANGYYELLVGVGSRDRSHLSARMSCVRMTAFAGLPSRLHARATREHAVGSHDAPDPGEKAAIRRVELHDGGPRDLCLWHGFDGNINAVPKDDLDSFLFSGTRFDQAHGWSVDAAAFGRLSHQFSTFSHCESYLPGHGWAQSDSSQSWDSAGADGLFRQYQYGASGPLADAASHFCWLTGVSTYGPTMSASLNIEVPRGASAPQWQYWTDTLSTMVGIQCVQYQQ
ncbi:MAG TPA: hypothetical protein VFQ61_20330 [Polyangiaceae bacterium]|nr:hypothetical protein [Polyangiaceae bacterium]